MVRSYTVLASAARTASGNSLDFTSDAGATICAAQFVIDVTAAAGTTPVLVVTIQGLDPTSGKYFTLLATANITAAGTTVLRVGPGFPVAANSSANDIMPLQWRVSYTITGTTPSFTFSVGATAA